MVIFSLVLSLACIQTGKGAAPLANNSQSRSQRGSVNTVLVPADGYTLEMLDEGHGSVTVILENGFGETLGSWAIVQRKLSKLARVIAYNRAGIGRSELSKTPRTADHVTEELRTALRSARIPPPYILVTHSAGALYARVFAYKFNSEIAGLLFIDAPTKEFYSWLQMHRPSVWQQLLDARAGFPPGLQQEAASVEDSAAEADLAWPLPSVPIEVIVSTKPQPPLLTGDIFEAFKETQLQFAKRAGARVRYSEASHNVPQEDPQLVIRTVLQIIEKISAKAAPEASSSKDVID